VEKNKAGDPAALKLAQKLVKDRPDSIPRLIAAGDLASTIGENQAALASYQSAWDKAKSGETLRRLYDAMVRNKKGPEALQLLKKWSAENPTDYDTRFLITSVAINEGRYDDAIAETEAMKGALPDNPVLLNNLAWLYGEKNNPRAFEIGAKALELATESPDILDTVGWLEVEKGDPKKGLTHLAKSYKLASANPVIAYHYAVALNRTGDKSASKATLTELLKTKAVFKERPDAEKLLKDLGG
jgi:tetratricopeptide (TPR) repeat protein